jgi:hypothetical protein
MFYTISFFFKSQKYNNVSFLLNILVRNTSLKYDLIFFLKNKILRYFGWYLFDFFNVINWVGIIWRLSQGNNSQGANSHSNENHLGQISKLDITNDDTRYFVWW